MVDLNKLIDEVVGQVAAEEQSAPTTEPKEPQQATVQAAQAPAASVTPTSPPLPPAAPPQYAAGTHSVGDMPMSNPMSPTEEAAQTQSAPPAAIPSQYVPSAHSVGDMPISHPTTTTEEAAQTQSAPPAAIPSQYVPSAHSVGDMPISHPSSYFADEDEDEEAEDDEPMHTDTVPPSTEDLYPEVLSNGELPTEQPVSGGEEEQSDPSGKPVLVGMDGTEQSDDPTALYDSERYNVPRSYKEALRILELQRSKPIYQSLMEGLGDPEAKRRAIDEYQARRNRYSGLVRLAEAIANTIDATGAQHNAYTQRRDPSYRYEDDTQRELARQYADLQRTEGMLYNARMRDAARYDRLSAEMRATENAGDQAARNEARYKQQLRQRAADMKRAAAEREQRAAVADAKWQAEMAMRDKQHKDRMGVERAKLALRRNELALRRANTPSGKGGSKRNATGGNGTANTYKRIPITISDKVNGHISVPANNPDYARKFFSDNFLARAEKEMEVVNKHHANGGKTFNSVSDFVLYQYGIDIMPLVGDVPCTPKEYQVAAEKTAAIAMRDPYVVLSYSVNSPFFGENGYDGDGVQVAAEGLREKNGGYLNALSILNAANKAGLSYGQTFAIMYPNIYESIASAVDSGDKSNLTKVVDLLADGYKGVKYCRDFKDASQMVSWLLDGDALEKKTPGFTEEEWKK